MTAHRWPSLVTGIITGAGFGLYLRLMTRSDLRVMVKQTLTVAALGAGISFGFRALF